MKNLLLVVLTMMFLPFASFHQVAASDGVTFNPGRVNFRTVLYQNCKPRKVVLTNHSGVAIENPKLVIGGSKAFRFQRSFRGCPNPLQAGASCRVYIDFCPQAHRSYKGTLGLSGSDEVGSELFGNGSSGGRG